MCFIDKLAQNVNILGLFKKSLGFQKVVQMMKICPIWSHWIYKTSYEQRVSKNVDILG